MLVLSRKAKEAILISDNIEITIIEVSGDKVKIGIEAPTSVKIFRKELCQTVESNKEAVRSILSAGAKKMLSGLGRK